VLLTNILPFGKQFPHRPFLRHGIEENDRNGFASTEKSTRFDKASPHPGRMQQGVANPFLR